MPHGRTGLMRKLCYGMFLARLYGARRMAYLLASMWLAKPLDATVRAYGWCCRPTGRAWLVLLGGVVCLAVALFPSSPSWLRWAAAGALAVGVTAGLVRWVGRIQQIKSLRDRWARSAAQTDEGLQAKQFASQAALVNALLAVERMDGDESCLPVTKADFTDRSAYHAPLTGRPVREVLAEGSDADATERAVEAVFEALNRFHRHGVCLGDFAADGMLINEAGGAVIIDLASATVYADINSLRFRLARDRDIEHFNALFDREKLTRSRFRETLAELSRDDRWYAPLDLGHGLIAGRIWKSAAGETKWEYIMRDSLLDLAQGARVLDLGCNNGWLCLLLLRHGARSAVGIEFDPLHAKQARFLKEAFEWADMRPYDFEILQTDMREICDRDMGQFDFVTALNCLYHLPGDEEIHRVVRRVRELTPVFVSQANLIPRDNAEREWRATVEYMLETLSATEFAEATVIEPSGYTHPLIVAHSRGPEPQGDAQPAAASPSVVEQGA
jgi:SAM-dependent methyltransferase